MSRRFPLAGLLLASLVMLGLALSSRAPADGPSLTVLAASSLTEALPGVGAAWTAAGHPPITFSFDGSSTLAKQIDAGAPADLYFSADTHWMDWLSERGRIEPGTRVDLLGNRLVLIVPASGINAPKRASDLMDPAMRRLALAGESVPAGRYARAALQSLGVWESVAPRVVSGDNVRTVLGWVATGEADAGVVYATDAAVEPRVRVAHAFPPDSYPPIVYPAAALKGAPHAKDAADFLAYCASPPGMAVFLDAGFTPPGAR